MKRIVTIAAGAFSILVLIYPMGALLCAILDYRFTLVNVPVFSLFLGLLSLFLAICAKYLRYTLLFPLLLPLSMFQGFSCFLACKSILVVLCHLVSTSCCGYITYRHGRPLALRFAGLLLSGILLLPMVFAGFLACTFGSFGQKEVVTVLDSPDGTYRAQVIASDQGALGGNTLVEVTPLLGFETILFHVQKEPQRIYTGSWQEAHTLEIVWQNENCLVINGIEYPIPPHTSI